MEDSEAELSDYIDKDSLVSDKFLESNGFELKVDDQKLLDRMNNAYNNVNNKLTKL